MTQPARGELARLAALAGWQRGQLDRVRADSAARTAIDRATGVLMERLGCPAEEAGHQIAILAAEAGLSLAEFAAEITGEPLVAVPPAARSRVSLASAAIAAAPDAIHLAEALLTEALAAEGADSVALWLLAPDGGMELVGAAGLDSREASQWRRVPPDVPFPPLQAVREGAEIWWPAGRPPECDGALSGPRPDRGRAVVPLRQRGACLGALEVLWPTALGEFPTSVRRLLPVLADSCAQVLVISVPDSGFAADYSTTWIFGLIDGLHRSALFARAIRDARGEVTGFVVDWASSGFRDPSGRNAADITGYGLVELYPAAASAGGLVDAAVQVLATGEPQHIPGLPLTGGGQMEVRLVRLFDGVVIAWRDVSESEAVAALLEEAQWLGRTGSWEESLVTGRVHWSAPTFAMFGLPPDQPVRLADLHTRVPADDLSVVDTFRARLRDQQEPVSAAFRIIRADDASVRQLRAFGRPVAGPGGEVIAVRGAYQDVSAHYHTQAAFSATRAQLADTQERAREEHQLAVRLQEAITPNISHPIEIAGIEVAARYQPAGQEHLVGGDWYDAVLLPDNSVLLAVGDVVGHGIGAVTGMVALRNYLRGLAITGVGPAALLALLNRAAVHLTGALATAICGIYDPASRTLCWARAGHLPPLLIRDGKAETPDLPTGIMLGAEPDACYQDATIKLRLGDTVVMFTDGLIERRDQLVDDALADLTRLASGPVDDVGELVGRLVELAPSDTGDDACVVAVTVR